eukprot:jgi/Botrbrau1/20365/Bobra.0006s0030.1
MVSRQPGQLFERRLDPKAEPLDEHPRFKKVRDLNRGTFGKVQLVLDTKTNELVAVKFVERGEKITKYVKAEILNQKRLQHPHIVELREVFLTSSHLGIVMEYASRGDLYHMVEQTHGLRECDARWFFQQLMCALDYCHRKGVANRDIKLENTLLHGETCLLLKLCDFGYSKHEKYQSAPGSRVGTPAYLAPEVILTGGGRKYDGKAADLWSCGVMLYILLTGSYPFGRPQDSELQPGQKISTMLQRILKVDYAFPANVPLSAECKDLVSRLLVANPANRITLPEILRHPWYLLDLPPGVAEMNDELLAASEEYVNSGQTVEAMEKIINEAMKLPPSIKDGGDSNFDFVDLEVNSVFQDEPDLTI